jgi:hypothetical protein
MIAAFPNLWAKKKTNTFCAFSMTAA